MALVVITHNKYKMAKNDNTIWWIIGIIFTIVILQHTGIMQQFSIVQQTVCAEKTISHWGMEGNVLDSKSINNGANNGAVFVNGKIGQAIEFNTNNFINLPAISSDGKTIIMWIKNYSSGGDWYFASETNGVNKGIIPLNSQFGLGFNGSVDEIAIFSPPLTSEEFATFSAGHKICYTTSYQENITCKDYATSQVTDQATGCLNYSGDFFPNCDYEWVGVTRFQIEDNGCIKLFYCQDTCLESEGCYETKQSCIKNLNYSCYVIQNNACVEKTDYETCVAGSDFYNNLTSCQENLPEGATSTTLGGTSSISPSETTGIKDKITKELFTIAGFKITIIHFVILLIIILVILYSTGVLEK